MASIISVGLLVRLEAKVGSEKKVEQFLLDALESVKAESATVTWVAYRINASTFGIFEGFRDAAGRTAHLEDRIAQALMAKGRDFLAMPPSITPIDILAEKFPTVTIPGGQPDTASPSVAGPGA